MTIYSNSVTQTHWTPGEQIVTVDTWHTLDEVGHHAAEMSSDILQDLQLFIVFCLQEHACQIHILQEKSTQSQRIPL